MIEAASGAIVIDGVNIADVGLYDLRKKITVVPQVHTISIFDNQITNLSILINIGSDAF